MSPRIGRMVGPPETTITADATPRPVASSEAGRFHWLALATGPDGKSTALEGKTMKQQVAKLPECPVHGTMQLQQTGTPEQAFCGTWYRCDKCTHSVLLPSRQLQAALAN